MSDNINLDSLKFDEKGLIPAVVIEAGTHKLLMVAWMNRESLIKSMETGLTCFWSRSRQELWTKGETSGNLQHIVSITADCDYDTLQVTRCCIQMQRRARYSMPVFCGVSPQPIVC